MLLSAIEDIETEETILIKTLKQDLPEFWKQLADAIGTSIVNHIIACSMLEKKSKKKMMIKSLFGRKEEEFTVKDPKTGKFKTVKVHY